MKSDFDWTDIPKGVTVCLDEPNDAGVLVRIDTVREPVAIALAVVAQFFLVGVLAGLASSRFFAMTLGPWLLVEGIVLKRTMSALFSWTELRVRDGEIWAAQGTWPKVGRDGTRVAIADLSQVLVSSSGSVGGRLRSGRGVSIVRSFGDRRKALLLAAAISEVSGAKLVELSSEALREPGASKGAAHPAMLTMSWLRDVRVNGYRKASEGTVLTFEVAQRPNWNAALGFCLLAMFLGSFSLIVAIVTLLISLVAFSGDSLTALCSAPVAAGLALGLGYACANTLIEARRAMDRSTLGELRNGRIIWERVSALSGRPRRGGEFLLSELREVRANGSGVVAELQNGKLRAIVQGVSMDSDAQDSAHLIVDAILATMDDPTFVFPEGAGHPATIEASL